jgi:hypothetical protein
VAEASEAIPTRRSEIEMKKRSFPHRHVTPALSDAQLAQARGGLNPNMKDEAPTESLGPDNVQK